MICFSQINSLSSEISIDFNEFPPPPKKKNKFSPENLQNGNTDNFVIPSRPITTVKYFSFPELEFSAKKNIEILFRKFLKMGI